MKKISLFTLMLAAGVTSFAQMKIGGSAGNPDGSAYLQLGDYDANKGLLHARVNLVSTTTWSLANPQPVDGMEVFNINSGITGPGAAGTGLYVWKNYQWNALGSSSTTGSAANAWSLGGNTTGAMKNLGTLDNYALPFITNGTEKMRISADGKVGIGMNNPLAPLEFAAGNGRKISLWGDASQFNNDNQYFGFGLSAGALVSQAPTVNHFFQWNAGTSATTSNTLMTLKGGKLGIGADPVTTLDVNGTALFRNGNNGGSFTNNQLLFGWAGAPQYQHAIKTRHQLGSAAGNSIDFYVWKNGTDAQGAVGTQHVMTLDGGNNGSVGIGTTAPTAKLEVNSGAANQSGLKFSNLNANSPTASGAAILGVDASGTVVTTSAPAAPTATYGTANLSYSYTIAEWTTDANVLNITLPSAGTYMVNYAATGGNTNTSSGAKAYCFLNIGNNPNNKLTGSYRTMYTTNIWGEGTGSGSQIVTVSGPTTIYLGIGVEQKGCEVRTTTMNYVKLSN